MLAIPFVGLFLAVVAGTRDGFFLTQAIVAAILVLPLAYLVLLLMIRQARGRSS